MSCTFHYLGSLMMKNITKTSKFEPNLGAKIKKKTLKNRIKDEYPFLIDFGPIFAPFGGSLGTILGPCWEILAPKMGVHHCSTPLLFEMQLQKWQNFKKNSILDRFWAPSGTHFWLIWGPFRVMLGHFSAKIGLKWTPSGVAAKLPTILSNISPSPH